MVSSLVGKRLPAGFREVRPEAYRVVVLFIDGEPDRRRLTLAPEPLDQPRGLAAAGRGSDQAELANKDSVEAIVQPLPFEVSRREDGYPQLAGYQAGSRGAVRRDAEPTRCCPPTLVLHPWPIFAVQLPSYIESGTHPG